MVPAAATVLAGCSSDRDTFVPGGTRGFEFIDPVTRSRPSTITPGSLTRCLALYTRFVRGDETRD